MTTSEPTTGTIVGYMRMFAGYGEHVNILNKADWLLLAADRLESQERDLETLRAFHERYAEQTSKQYVVAVCGLTARAEQAEAREKAAVNNAVRAVFYDTSNGKRGLLVDAGICDYCQSDKGERIKCKSCFENGNFELRNDLRGLPQDGEGV